MEPKVIENLPVDLVLLCYADLNPDSEEGKLLLPPSEILSAIAEATTTGEVPPLLSGWITTQRQVAEEAHALVRQLPAFEGTEMPGWMGQKWAERLGAPWAAGLADAVREGKAWLASQ
jgi:hypothetical protein